MSEPSHKSILSNIEKLAVEFERANEERRTSVRYTHASRRFLHARIRRRRKKSAQHDGAVI